VCVCVCVCETFGLYVTSPITMTTDSTFDIGAGHMFRNVEIACPTPILVA